QRLLGSLHVNIAGRIGDMGDLGIGRPLRLCESRNARSERESGGKCELFHHVNSPWAARTDGGGNTHWMASGREGSREPFRRSPIQWPGQNDEEGRTPCTARSSGRRPARRNRR